MSPALFAEKQAQHQNEVNKFRKLENEWKPSPTKTYKKKPFNKMTPEQKKERIDELWNKVRNKVNSGSVLVFL